MDVFDMAVANGMMNISHAKACLKAKKEKIIRSPVLSVRAGMEESGAGMKVIRWLISSGTSVDNQFLTDQDFATLLMEFMVAEGLQEQAWRWIKRSFRNVATVAALPAGKTFELARRELAGPLRALVCAELEHNASFDAAYMCISRAAGYLNGASSHIMSTLKSVLISPRSYEPNPREFLEKLRESCKANVFKEEDVSAHPISSSAPKSLAQSYTDLSIATALQPAGMILLKETCMLNVSHPSPSETSFESFVGLVPIINPIKTSLYLAHLSLLHPTKPDASLALDYLRAESSDQKIRSWALVPAKTRSIVIQLGLDTAKLLLEQNRYSEMEWTMSFLGRNFPDQLGIGQKRQLEQVKAEASSIELLSSIGIA
jgi:hypothetical protein